MSTREGRTLDAGGSRTFRSPGQEVAVALARAADALTRRFAEIVEPHGLTLQQYNVLRILSQAHPAPLPTLEIGQRLVERTPGVTRLLDRLEAKGLVRRERSRDDRRLVLCRISPRGIHLLASLEDEMDYADDTAVQALDERELATLLSLLRRVRGVGDNR